VTDVTETLRFPDGFLWGSATAAHQIEGGNWNNDWWEWEHTPGSGTTEPSGDACDSWNRWEEDVELVAEMGLGTYRFSLEWSRIEPENGEWSRAAIDHYRAICEALRARGIQATVTFNHFTVPRWVAAQGSWANPATVDDFVRFVAFAGQELSDVMDRACTLNEPNIVAMVGYLAGQFPPGTKDVAVRRQVNEHLVDAHRRSVEAIRKVAPNVPVGLTLAMSDYQAVDGGESKRDQIRHSMEDVFLDAVEGDDFVGVQTYSRTRVGPDGMVGPEPGVPTTEMGYEFWPQSLEATLRRAWDYTGGNVPLLVTENGIGTHDDTQRIDYVRQALEGVGRCLADGLDVRGYTYWSLLDNFEWALGYRPTFGLVEVDRETFVRTPKPSARWFAEVVKANALV
jgi:beta-glucosidase